MAHQLADLGRCIGGVVTCGAAGSEADACRLGAQERCERAVVRAGRRTEALARTIARRCGEVDADVLFAPDGLGFAALAPVCPALGTVHADAIVLGACLAGGTACRGEHLLATALPRAGELVRAAGVAAPLRAALGCLDDRGGNGMGVRDVDAAAAVARCTRTLARASARVVTRSLANLQGCARVAAGCRERSAEDARACVDDATVACAGALARVEAAESAFRRAIVARCGPAALDSALAASATGVGFDALRDECAAVGVDETGIDAVAECLTRRAACDALAVVRDTTPRIEDVLALVGASFDRPYCDAPRPTSTLVSTPTPVPTVTLRATATVVGPTRTPMPGETATPTAHVTTTPSPRATPSRTVTPLPQPTATPFCGNGVVDDGEECDGAEFDDNTCEDLCFESDPTGTLGCTSRCRIDFSGCRGVDCEVP